MLWACYGLWLREKPQVQKPDLSYGGELPNDLALNAGLPATILSQPLTFVNIKMAQNCMVGYLAQFQWRKSPLQKAGAT